jgi:hypothetical protein
MMGRLTPEEWRPLLASAIIYDYFLLRSEFRDSGLHLLLPIGLGTIASGYATLQIILLGRLAYGIELVWANIILSLVYFSSVIALYK